MPPPSPAAIASDRVPRRFHAWPELAFLVAGLALMLAAAAAVLFAYSPGPDPSRRTDSTHVVFRDIAWSDLSPKEWDPTRKLRHADGSLVSDMDPRAKVMLDELRAVWDNAPTVGALDGTAIRMPGYVVPLDEVDGRLTEFLLVPYFGACIHTPPPPANQIVHVLSAKGVRGVRAMDTVWVSGRMATLRQDSPMGTSGYRLDAAAVEPYRPPADAPAKP